MWTKLERPIRAYVDDMMEDERWYEHEKTVYKPTEDDDTDIDTNAF